MGERVFRTLFIAVLICGVLGLGLMALVLIGDALVPH